MIYDQGQSPPEEPDEQRPGNWNVAEWHGKRLIDRNGEKIGKLQDVYVDVETDEPRLRHG